MKFWQLLDIFRDEQDLLISVFKKDKWLFYLDFYKNLESLVEGQNREVLDRVIDDELLKDICSNSKKVIYLSHSRGKIYSYRSNIDLVEISILKAVDMFGHNSIEEVFEKTESVIR